MLVPSRGVETLGKILCPLGMRLESAYRTSRFGWAERRKKPSRSTMGTATRGTP